MNSYIGFDIGASGMVDAENVTMSTIDIQSVVNHGILTIDTGLITNTATGILSTNDLTINDVSFLETGVAIDVVSGSAEISVLALKMSALVLGLILEPQQRSQVSTASTSHSLSMEQMLMI